MTRNVLEYLERSAERFADKPAFVDEAGSLTFGQLRDRAQRIGSALCAMDGGSRPVPVYMEKRAEEIAAFLGVVYAGRAYAPIDPLMPEKRVARILETLEAHTVIADEACGQKLADMGYSGTVLPVEALERHEVDADALKRVRRAAIDCDLLYIIFTSGSTGYPKGVGLSHRAVIDFVEWFSKAAGFDSSCVFGNQAPFYFDMSVKDIYSTLKNGATTYIIPKRLFNFPVQLFEYIVGNGINTLAWATSAVCLAAKEAAFEKVCPSTVKRVCFGGEAMPLKLLNIWRRHVPDALYMNMYGPTETAVDCTYHIVDKNREYTDACLPAGYPCENTGILILNGDRAVEDGEIGEICVRGSSLANGYYNDPEKTAGAFVQNPLQSAYPERIYRTGDNGYYNERGEIMFASRKDDQIKHMGYRIELGEIETALSEVGGIERCCCLFDRAADKIVCVYVGTATKKEIILEVGKSVPKYMWPNRFVQLEEMPMNPNGKIDRTKLKAEYIDG